MADPVTTPSGESGAAPRSPWKTYLFSGLVLVLVVVCTLGAGVVAYTNYVMKRGFSEDPAVCQERLAEIATIELPADFVPTNSYKFSQPFSDQPLIEWVVCEQPGRVDLLLLGEIAGESEAVEPLVASFDRSLRENWHLHEAVIPIDSTKERREFTIRGKPATFIFAQGEGAVEGGKFRMAMGKFEGHFGTCVLSINVEEASYQPGMFERVIESIR